MNSIFWTIGIFQIQKCKSEVLGQKTSKYTNLDLQAVIWKIFERLSWICIRFYSFTKPNVRKIKSKFEEIEARKNIRVINFGIFCLKRNQCLTKLAFLENCCLWYKCPSWTFASQNFDCQLFTYLGQKIVAETKGGSLLWISWIF